MCNNVFLGSIKSSVQNVICVYWSVVNDIPRCQSPSSLHHYTMPEQNTAVVASYLSLLLHSAGLVTCHCHIPTIIMDNSTSKAAGPQVDDSGTRV